tara:strand:- start:910 stop:1182 length:273 start_codon:yes stop_codon:yes gene_type:complete
MIWAEILSDYANLIRLIIFANNRKMIQEIIKVLTLDYEINNPILKLIRFLWLATLFLIALVVIPIVSTTLMTIGLLVWGFIMLIEWFAKK